MLCKVQKSNPGFELGSLSPFLRLPYQIIKMSRDRYTFICLKREVIFFSIYKILNGNNGNK